MYKRQPVHNVKEATEYPATLILTGDHDDRVVPAHSFKFAAHLQDKQRGENPTLIRIETNAGHGSGTPISKKIEEAAVFGIPDEKYGEVVAAWVKVKEPTKEEEILAFCSEQIAHFKVPSHIKFVKEFPMTVSGKIQKFLMRDAMIKELGLKEAETA